MKNLDLLIPKQQELKDSYLWATVASLSPLSIRLDGEAEPLEATPDALVKRIEIGQRVWCQLHGRRIIILGAANGEQDDPLTAAHETHLTGLDSAVDALDGRLDTLEANAPTAIVVGKSTAQSIPSNTTTVIAFNTTKFAATGGMTLSSGTVVIPKTGWYQVTGHVTFSASTSGARRAIWVGKGSTAGSLSTFVGMNAVASAQATSNLTTLTASSLIHCTADEVVGVATYVVGVTWTLDVSESYMNNLSVHYVGG